MTTEKLTELLKSLNGIDDTFYFEKSGNYYWLENTGLKYNIASDNGNDMAHFLKAFKRTRLKATVKNIETASNVLGMDKSLRAYGRGSVDSILNDEYMNGDLYNGISTRAKRIIIEYLLSVVKEHGYAGEDSEGGSYNYLTLVELAK